MSVLATLDTVITVLEQLEIPVWSSQGSYTKYKNTNFVPSHEDVQSIRNVVLNHELKLTSLGNEISKIDAILERLQRTRERLVESKAEVDISLKSHKSLVSVIRRLPTEIMGEIFVHCLPCEQYIRPRIKDCPLLLTRVCRRWRMVALSVPQLWCSLSVSMQRVTGSLSTPYEQWLARAKSVPLTISVVVDDDHQEDTLPSNTFSRHQLMGWLRPCISRCKDLWVADTGGAPFYEVLHSAPSLERLQITGCRLPDEGFAITNPSTHLRNLCLRFIAQDIESLPTFNLPSYLTDLTLTFSRMGGETLVHVFKSCPQLERLSLSLLSVHNTDVTSIRQLGTLVHPSIRRIEMRVARGLDILLDALTLPQLEQLDICFCGRDSGPWPHVQFKAFLARSRCPLEGLVVRWKKLCPDQLKEYAELLPCLQVHV